MSASYDPYVEELHITYISCRPVPLLMFQKLKYDRSKAHIMANVHVRYSTTDSTLYIPLQPASLYPVASVPQPPPPRG